MALINFYIIAATTVIIHNRITTNNINKARRNNHRNIIIINTIEPTILERRLQRRSLHRHIMGLTQTDATQMEIRSRGTTFKNLMFNLIIKVLLG